LITASRQSCGSAAEEAYRLFESKGLPRAIVGNRVVAMIRYELQAVWDFSHIQEGLIEDRLLQPRKSWVDLETLRKPPNYWLRSVRNNRFP